MQDDSGPAQSTDVHACFVDLLEGRRGDARMRFSPATVAEAESLLAQHLALEASGAAGAVLASGCEFDGFRIEAPLGRGASGEVFSAHELATGRAVAVKLLPRELSRAGSERVHRETLALAALEHPGIARLYRSGLVSDEASTRRYIAMELVRDARTLSEWRAAAPRSPRACVTILADICDAVAYAHGRGVIHCDLKPGNILVDAAGRAVVIDFGISRILDSEGNPAETVSILGDRVRGTLAYIAPESLEPRAGADVRADVHALGAILYELLAECPFRALDGLALPQRIAAIATAEPPRLASAGRAFRGDLDRIVARATARDPRARYASASQLAADLRAHLAGLPVLPELQPPRERLARAIARHRIAVSIGLAISATLVAASAVSLGFAARSRAEARLANLSVAARAIDDADLLIAKQHVEQLGPDDGAAERGILERALGLKGRLIDAGDWYDAAWSPDGSWFVANGHPGSASAPSEPMLARFDRTEDAGFTMRWSIPAGESGIHGSAVSADGLSVVDIDGDGALRVIDPEDGRIRARVEPPQEADSHLAVDVRPDGLIAFDRGALELRTLAEPGRSLAASSPGLGVLRMLAFAPSGSNLLACAGDRGAAILDATTATVVQRLETPAAFQCAACWSDDGSRLFLAGWDRTVRAYAPGQSAPLWKSHGHRDSIWSIERFDARTIATAGADGTLRLWDQVDGSPVAAVPIGDDVIWNIAVHASRDSILVASRGGLREVDMRRVRDWAGRPGHRAAIANAAMTAAEPSEDGSVAIRVAGSPGRSIVPPGDGPVDRVALSSDGGILAALRRDGTISVIRLGDERVLSTTRAFAADDLHEPNGITGLALHARAGRLLLASRKYGCASVDIATGETRWRVPFGSQCTAVAVSPDGRAVFVSDRDGQIGRLDAADGSVEASVRRQRTRPACLATSADGGRLLVGGADGSMRILDASTLEEQFAIRVSPSPLRSIRATDRGIEAIDKVGVLRVR